jgi:hypothetical protein
MREKREERREKDLEWIRALELPSGEINEISNNNEIKTHMFVRNPTKFLSHKHTQKLNSHSCFQIILLLTSKSPGKGWVRNTSTSTKATEHMCGTRETWIELRNLEKANGKKKGREEKKANECVFLQKQKRDNKWKWE